MSLDLQPLTGDSMERTLPNDTTASLGLGSMNLCFRNDEVANIVDQLVIYDNSFGTTSEDDKIKVKLIKEDEIIEVEKRHIKVHTLVS